MSRASILLVDDNFHQHELFKCYAMKSSLVELNCALSLDEAIDCIRLDPPAAIFLDNQLHPYSSYRETVPILRDAGYDGKIVVISADVSGKIFAEYKNHSVNSCLNKFDFNLSNFTQRVSEAIN